MDLDYKFPLTYTLGNSRATDRANTDPGELHNLCAKEFYGIISTSLSNCVFHLHNQFYAIHQYQQFRVAHLILCSSQMLEEYSSVSYHHQADSTQYECLGWV